MNTGNLVKLVISTARELGDEAIDAIEQLDANTELFGEGGYLDSMALVTLIIALEQNIEDQFGATVVLADAKAMSQSSSPFRTVASLAQYAEAQLGN